MILFFYSCPIFHHVQKMSKISHDLRFFSHVPKISSKFYIDTSIFPTISPYFNSSYYSFFTFLTLYSILFNISKNKFLLRPNGEVLTPKPPLPTPLADIVYN